MPIVDMPLEQLRSYEGGNPCPEDIDEYWDRALDEMRAVDPRVELVPSSFQTPSAECFDLSSRASEALGSMRILRPRE